jgi:hypothetical protein
MFFPKVSGLFNALDILMLKALLCLWDEKQSFNKLQPFKSLPARPQKSQVITS